MAKKTRAARRRPRTALGLTRRHRMTPTTPSAPPAAGPAAPPTAGPAAPATAGPAAPPPPAPVTHEQIALRAYELHRSGAEGDALAHWLAAERELVRN
jgi:hypothetical protein